MTTFKDKIKKKRPDINLSDFVFEDIESAKSDGRFLTVDPDELIPDVSQPRKHFDDEKIKELRESIEKRGQLQPVVVGNKSADGKYPIIAGERRWRAISQSSVIKRIDVVIVSVDEELDILGVQIEENSKRQDISAYESAMAMRRVVDLAKKRGMNQGQAAAFVGVSPSWLSKMLALAAGNELIVNLMREGVTNDVNALYELNQLAESNIEAAREVIQKAESGHENIRQLVNEALKSANKAEKAEDVSSHEKNKEKKTTESVRRLTVDSLTVNDIKSGGQIIVTITSGGNVIELEMTSEIWRESRNND